MKRNLLVVFVTLLIFLAVLPALAQGEAPPDPAPSDPALVALAFWFAMSGAVTGFMEYFKSIILQPVQSKFKLSDDVYGVTAHIFAFGTAFVLVLTVADDRTVFDAIHINLSNHLMAQIGTAFLVSLGNSTLHQLYDLFLGWASPPAPAQKAA